MSRQLEVVRFRDLVQVQSIPRFVEGLSAPTIEILGDDFRSVDRVLINEVSSPEFLIVNQGTLYVQIPDSVRRINTVEVLSSKFTKTTQSSKLSYEIGNKTLVVEGILKLLQLFVKWLLQSPGSDIFDPDRGGGLLELVGQTGTSRRMGPTIGAVSRSVQATVSQIRAAQINVTGLPLSERLLSADVVDFDIFERQMEIRAKISLTSMAGKEAVASLEL
jgi:hypothetical protein